MMQPGALVWRLRSFDVLGSTSDLCRTLAERGEAEGLAVLARRQEGGRGTQGRQWSSPEGNLYISILLRPAGPAETLAQWSLLTAVAVAESVATLLPEASVLQLKWPNDLLLRGGKLSGILAEGAPGWLVIGIGVNLTSAPAIAGRATACLADVVALPAPEAMAHLVLERLGQWRDVFLRDGFAPIRHAWLHYAPPLGSAMSVQTGPRVVTGRFAGLAEDGRLRLAGAGGEQVYAAGEVTLLGNA